MDIYMKNNQLIRNRDKIITKRFEQSRQKRKN